MFRLGYILVLLKSVDLLKYQVDLLNCLVNQALSFLKMLIYAIMKVLEVWKEMVMDLRCTLGNQESFLQCRFYFHFNYCTKIHLVVQICIHLLAYKYSSFNSMHSFQTLIQQNLSLLFQEKHYPLSTGHVHHIEVVPDIVQTSQGRKCFM